MHLYFSRISPRFDKLDVSHVGKKSGEKTSRCQNINWCKEVEASCTKPFCRGPWYMPWCQICCLSSMRSAFCPTTRSSACWYFMPLVVLPSPRKLGIPRAQPVSSLKHNPVHCGSSAHLYRLLAKPFPSSESKLARTGASQR